MRDQVKETKHFKEKVLRDVKWIMKDRSGSAEGVADAINVAGFLIQANENKHHQLGMLEAVRTYFEKVEANLDEPKKGRDFVLCSLNIRDVE